ncbi:MAG: FG-GAP-like repeat-containing protein [bacterium]
MTKKFVINGVRVLCAVLCVGLAGNAQAQWPPPDDDQIDLSDPQYWPNDSYDGRWNYWSWIHPDAVEAVQAFSPYELALGSGLSADKAWQKTIGDRRVVLAVLDSGIRWRTRDLANKFYLNAGELPPPDAGCTGDGTTYDVNGDGVFNVQDYTTNTGHDQPNNPCDTRLLNHPGGWDVNGNGFLDPQDLIAIFSDGIDDDLNGYVDDISGWDVYNDDNDPADDTEFGHGTGEAEWSAAEGNNGIGSLGVCPECSIMMVRVGESFVVDGNDFAVGAIFAVDTGAAVIQEALGAINNPKLARDALDYAWDNDVVAITSAADEDSYHHNFPGTGNHTIYVHAIQHDSSNWRQAKTYLNFANCTNYGAQLALSAPGTACSSESTGRTAGIAGLIISMALQADVPFPGGAPNATDKLGARRLRSDEVRQLLITTVDDIYDPASATDPERYPTRVGWEQRFGYGRTNASKAVRQVDAGRIPPVVDVTRPYWFEPIVPSQTPTVDIEGEIAFRSLYDSVDYVIEWAPGIEPDDADFTTIASDTGVTAAMTGVLASWDVSGITVDNPPEPWPDNVVNRFLVTLRIRVTANSSNPDLDGVYAERRRAFHIFEDPDLLPGFPIYMDASGESSPKTADIDGDGVREIVIGDANGLVHVIKGDGSHVPGWPAQVNLLPHLNPANPANHLDSSAFVTGALDAEVRSSIVASPAVADLQGNGEQEVVIATLDGFVYVFDSAGNELPGFPVELDRSLAINPSKDNNVDSGIFASPVIEDMDGDGDYEIIVSAYDGHLYMWHHTGDTVSGFPVKLSVPGDTEFARSLSSPGVGDIDGDGSPDIVVGTNQAENAMAQVYAVHADGNDHPGGPFLDAFPIGVLTIETLPLVGVGIYSAPALADIDGDGILEFAINGNVGPPMVYSGDGFVYRAMENGNPADPYRSYGPGSDSSDMPLQIAFTNPVFADFNNDGRMNVLQGAGGLLIAAAFASGGTRIDFDHLLGAWDIQSGRFLYHYPRKVDDWQFFMAPAVADLDGDGMPEAIQASAGSYVHAMNRYGVEPTGWPKFVGGWILGSPAVGDINGDGNLDVIASSRNGWLFAWSTTGPTTGRIEWESYKHDNRNTGNYHTPLDQGTLEVPCDDDLDGDGIPNAEDGDIDGDGIPNQDDDDVDGDGIPNDWDYDDDGDCVQDQDDDTPTGPEGTGDATDNPKDGCGCATGAHRDAGAPLLFLLFILIGLVCRRRRT